MPLIKIQAFNTEQIDVAEIENVEDIIFDESFYSKFIEGPTISTKNNQYVARVHFVAKKPVSSTGKISFFKNGCEIKKSD
jgi:hypothetical protein